MTGNNCDCLRMACCILVCFLLLKFRLKYVRFPLFEDSSNCLLSGLTARVAP